MVDRGPLLTSAIIFYLAIGAAIFEVLEEPHWKESKTNYYTQKVHLLKEFPCLGQDGLDKILQSLSRVRLFCNSMDYSPPGSSVHGFSQTRIPEWVAISFSRGVFPTQGSNLCLLQANSLPLTHQHLLNGSRLTAVPSRTLAPRLAYHEV